MGRPLLFWCSWIALNTHLHLQADCPVLITDCLLTELHMLLCGFGELRLPAYCICGVSCHSHSSASLPVCREYNTNFVFADTDLIGLASPLVMHFANEKPFEAAPEDPEWPWLCWQPQQRGQPNERFTAKHRESHNQTHPEALLHDRFHRQTEAPDLSGKSFLQHWRHTGLG